MFLIGMKKSEPEKIDNTKCDGADEVAEPITDCETDSATEIAESLECIDGKKKLSWVEQTRRKNSVRMSRALFRGIDILFRAPQNSCPYVTRRNVGTIEYIADIVYDESLPEICKADLYRVGAQEKQPVVLYIHGGGFTAGGKKYRRGVSQYFALNGFSVFCVDYGLSPDYKFPDPLMHLVAAANFIYDNSERFGVDGERIIVAGDSAGAYYASMLAAFNGNEALKDAFGFAPKFRIFGALLNCGIYDIQTVFDTKYALDVDDAVFIGFAGIRKGEFDGFKYKETCDPVKQITREYPPVFITYSIWDIFCRGQSEALAEVLERTDVYFEKYCARHRTSNHCFSLNWRGEDASSANELMMSFAKRLASDRIKLD